MSGPALRHLESHHAIHESARHEAEVMTNLLERALLRADSDLAVQLAFVLLEHWETRTLCHAESEETGLYRDIVRQEPEKEPTVHALTRDHELMRTAAQEIKERLQYSQPDAQILRRFQLLLWIEQTHSRDEEHRLVAALNRKEVVR